MEHIPVRHITETAFFDILRLSGEGMTQQLHRHSFFYILVIEKGTGIHTIDFINHPITDHSVFFLRPGQVHELTLDPGTTGYRLKFNQDFFTPAKKTGLATLNEYALSTVENIYRENNNKEAQYQQAIQSYLNILFISLQRQHQIQELQQNYMLEKLEELQELIATSIVANKQVAWYASKLNLTPYQLNAITKATLDKTCSEVITDYILLEAKRYLLATSNQVTQIAWHLGYEDVSYFIRFFKKHTGYSPDAFRK